jgi:coproporphyrinogen III oxidase
LQKRICTALADGGKTFLEDAWERPGDDGHSRVLERGEVFEKGGINLSHVFGEELPP